jgi:hypothetical protein
LASLTKPSLRCVVWTKDRVPSPPGCQSAISAPLPPFWRPFLLTTGTASARPWTTSSSTLATDNVMAAAFEHEEGHRTLATPHPMLHQTHMAYWPTHVASHTLSRSLLLLASRTIHGYASPLTYATRAAAPHEPLSALSRLNSQHLTEPCSDMLTTTRVWWLTACHDRLIRRWCWRIPYAYM